MFFVSILIVFLFRAGFGLKLVCHRIYSNSTTFVVFLLRSHFLLFFSFCLDVWAVNQGTDDSSMTIQ